jgi:hypothetical protein
VFVFGGVNWREAMKCPFCESVMASGKVGVEKSTFGEVVNVLGVIAGGISFQPYYLYFRQIGGGAPSHVEHCGEAFPCEQCQALIIKGTKASAPAS